MNFTKSDLTVEKGAKIIFSCLFCDIKQTSILGQTSNIKHHLMTHVENKDLVIWFQHYDKIKVPTNKFVIDNETLRIVKYFIASNTAASNFDCPYFRDLMRDFKRPIPCSDTFSDVILKSVFEKVKQELGQIMEASISICLISDIWTNKQMLDFMGLAANIINSNFERETIVIGMILMPGNHCAENIKLAIESIVNDYSFDKSKLSGILFIH